MPSKLSSDWLLSALIATLIFMDMQHFSFV